MNVLACVVLCVCQLKPDDLLKISQTTLEDILLCEAKAGLHSTAHGRTAHGTDASASTSASAQSSDHTAGTFPYSDQSSPHHPSTTTSASTSTLSPLKRRGGSTGSGGVHSPHAHQATHSSGGKSKRRRTSRSTERERERGREGTLKGNDDMDVDMDRDRGDNDDEGMHRGGDRDKDSSRGGRNRSHGQEREQGHGQNDDDDEEEEEYDEEEDEDVGEGGRGGKGGGYDHSSADGSPDRYTSLPTPLNVSRPSTHINTKTDRDRDRDRDGVSGRNGDTVDDVSSLTQLMHNTAATATATSHDTANTNGIPFGARNGDTTHLSADSGSSADRPYGGQGLGVEGNQLEYLEESFQLIALMVRGNAARIKDDMK